MSKAKGEHCALQNSQNCQDIVRKLADEERVVVVAVCVTEIIMTEKP